MLHYLDCDSLSFSLVDYMCSQVTETLGSSLISYVSRLSKHAMRWAHNEPRENTDNRRDFVEGTDR